MIRTPLLAMIAGILLSGASLPAGDVSGPCGSGACCTNQWVVPQALGPCEMPCRLEGLWKISLCIEISCDHMGHAWLRYEKCPQPGEEGQPREVHTVGRYRKGYGGEKATRCSPAIPPAHVSGVIYDLDLKREKQIAAGEIYMISTWAMNPIVFRGENNGVGHGLHLNNCNTHVRDGWYYFTGEWYDLPCLYHTSGTLLRRIARRHPEIKCGH